MLCTPWCSRNGPQQQAIDTFSLAGLRILTQGGNAVDSAITTALCQGIMSPAASGLGGGHFMIIRSPNGTTEVIDAREVAPAAATENMFKGVLGISC